MKKMSPEELNRLFYLLGSLRDERTTEEEFSELSGILEGSGTAQEYYVDYIYLCTDLYNLQTSLKSIKQDDGLSENRLDKQDYMKLLDPQLTLDMLQVWADYEKTAKALELPKIKETEKIVVKKVPLKVAPRKISKLSMGTLLGSIAALLFLVVYVHLNPRYSFEVATLSNAVDAQWSSFLPLQKGSRLSISSSDPIQLQKGVIEIESDNGVTVTIEAPAEFSFISADEILMNYGQLFASVSPAGRGFGVQTQNSKILDLGTNFGVFSDLRGKTELHVFKGKTILIAGQKGQDKKTVEVSGGQACRIDSYDSNVTNITLNHNMFAQGIDSDTGLLITGGRQIDLADIVGGGDGTGNGTRNKGLQWDGADLVSNADLLQQDAADFPKDYVVVNCNPLIDGVFVPYGKGEDPLVLTSNASTLDLDDFIASDTNGQLTLMLIHESTDENSAYWFCSKEAAGNDPEKYPTLTFPNASPGGAMQVTTAYKNGADAYVSNDMLRSPRQTLGKWPTLSCRYFQDERVKIVFLRFDISDMKGDLTGAALSLYLSCGNRYRDLHVYGLADGPADVWDETTISYNTAPGLLLAEHGNYQLDDTGFDFLGTFAVVDNRIKTEAIQITANKMYSWSVPSTKWQSAYVISNAGRYVDDSGTTQTLMLDSVACGTEENPSIFMHANAGVTLDLEAIRRVYGPVSIQSFTAVCGISKPAMLTTLNETTVYSSASFHVLIDGQEVFSAIDMSPEDTPQSIDIKLHRQARYLTLVATQGTDNSVTNDLCLFVNPALNLK